MDNAGNSVNLVSGIFSLPSGWDSVLSKIDSRFYFSGVIDSGSINSVLCFLVFLCFVTMCRQGRHHIKYDVFVKL